MKVLGLDTLVEVVDTLGSETAQGPLSIECVEGLAIVGYNIFIVDTISKGTQT